VTAATILVAEDDAKTAAILRLYLEGAGFRVLTAARGEDALRLARSEAPDLVLLDRMLGGVSGDAVCRALRAEGATPVIFVTARVEEEDRLRGLGWGADDYVTKPFSPREVVARVRAVLRRTRPADREEDRVLRAGTVAIDIARHRATLGGEPLPLTPTEFRLLRALVESRGRPLSRSVLAERALPGESDALERTVDAHVMKIRRKLRAREASGSPEIETVFGVGYRLGGTPLGETDAP
jgi:DNA-binding response OmpR family regulator